MLSKYSPTAVNPSLVHGARSRVPSATNHELPRFRLVHPGARPEGFTLSSLSIALVTSGRILVRGGVGAPVALGAGSIILCRSQRGLWLSTRIPVQAELIILAYSRRWLEQALDLAGGIGLIFNPEDALLGPQRADTIELGRRIRHAWMLSELQSSPGQALQLASRWLDIAAKALVAVGPGLDTDPEETDPQPLRIRSHPLLPTLLELIERADGVPPSLSTLASSVGLSERQTSRLFRDQMGVSFREYIARIRIERAMQSLEDISRSITEIALSSGWNSISQFNAAFRKHTGQTPRTYRASLKKTASI